MSISPETSLLAKALWSGIIVLGLTYVAERVSTRIAGLLSGAPMTAVLVYYFVGTSKGDAYIIESVPHGIASFTATLAFVFVYHHVSIRVNRYTASVSCFAGVAAYSVVALVLVEIPFTISTALGLTLSLVVFSAWCFRKIEARNVENPERYTARLLAMRACSTTVFILTLITLAEALGPRWTGLLGGFPATLLPTLFILHLTYGADSTHSVVRNFPLGLGSILLYMLSVPVTFPRWGILGGIAVSVVVSLTYLSIVMLWSARREQANSES